MKNGKKLIKQENQHGIFTTMIRNTKLVKENYTIGSQLMIIEA